MKLLQFLHQIFLFYSLLRLWVCTCAFLLQTKFSNTTSKSSGRRHLKFQQFLVLWEISKVQNIRKRLRVKEGKICQNVEVSESVCLLWLGMYFVSSILLMRMNLPFKYRRIITEVLGEDLKFHFYHQWFDFIFVVSAIITIFFFGGLRIHSTSNRLERQHLS